MDTFKIFALFVAYIVISYIYAVKRKEDKRTRPRWFNTTIFSFIVLQAIISVFSITRYFRNIFGNVIMGAVLFIMIISILIKEKRKESERLLSTKMLFALVALTLLFMINFSTITNKIQFISKGDGIIQEDIEEGDILFRHTGILDSFIPGYWSHIGLYAGNGSVIESTTHGIRIVSIKDFVGSDYVSVAKVKTADDTQKKLVVRWAVKKVGLPYNFFLISKGEDQDAYYCSELIWAAYKQIGIDLDANPGFALKYGWAVAPQEIFGDDDVTIYHINKTVKEQL